MPNPSHSWEELIDFIMEKGKKHFTDPKATAHALKDAACKAHRLRGGLWEPVNLILATSIETASLIRLLSRNYPTSGILSTLCPALAPFSVPA